MPGISDLLVFIETFTHWIEAFPTTTEKAMEVSKALIKKIIPRFGFPSYLQSYNGPPFVSTVAQSLTSALEITCKFHSSWKRQSSGKVKQAHQTLTRPLGKPCQGTPESWLWFLPMALLRCHTAPQEPYEMFWKVCSYISPACRLWPQFCYFLHH